MLIDNICLFQYSSIATIVSVMIHSKLFDRIEACSLAMRHVRGQQGHQASYDHVMASLPLEEMTKYVNKNLTRACKAFIRAGFANRNTCDRKVNIAMCVAISIASDQAASGLTKEICDRLRGVEDFDRYVMTEIFNFSTVNDRVLAILDNAIIRKKKNVNKDIQHEFCIEFVLTFFGIVESALRRGVNLGELGYVTTARPSDMKHARVILEKHVSSIAARLGPCFQLKALKKTCPRINLFPTKDAFPLGQIGSENIDFDEATVYTLKDCLLDTKEKDEFLDIIFATISHSHEQPADTFAGMRLETTKTFFLETVLDKTVADEVLKAISKTPQEQRLCEEVASLKKTLADVSCETKSIKSDLLFSKVETERARALFDSQKEELAVAERESNRLRTLRNN